MNTLYFLTAASQNRIVRRFTRALGLLAVLAAMLNAQATPAAASPSPVRLWVKVARGPECLSGLGFCIGFGTDRADGTARSLATFQVDKELDKNQPNKMTITFPEGTNQQGEEFVLDQDIALDSGLALSLGYQKITMEAGRYPVKRSATSPSVSVEVDIQAVGIYIDIQIGRRSQGCRGFGICSITIGAERAGMAPGSITVKGSKASVDFLLDLGGVEGESLVIDEDIVLDRATSLALGYQAVTIVKGTYPVDYSSNPNGHVDVDVRAAGLYINVEVGKRSLGCTGFGICSITIGWERMNAPGVSATIDGNRMGWDFLLDIEPDTNRDEITIDEDIVLDRKTSLAFGYQSVTVKRGTYAIDYSSNPNGHVDVDVETQGLTIVVKIGRAWQVCRGVGICDIDIRLDAFSDARTAPGSASLDGNRLHVDFLLEIDDTMDALTIDEDIVLDEASSLALGAKSVKILKGTYAIDRSQNPNGSVVLNVMRFGITITIEAGRGASCTRFGICSITVGWHLRTVNSVPTIVSTLDGQYKLDFTRRVPNSEDVFVLDEPVVITGAAAHALGHTSITLKPGSYAVDYSSNPNGSVVIPAAPQGIIIRIKIGLASQGCRGFGFCGIDILRDEFGANMLRGAARATKSTLHVEMMDSLGERRQSITIDEGIQLDKATARALGFSSVFVKPGTYAVDYGTNPNGSVDLAIETRGLTITIRFGDPVRNCGGFGLCSITLKRNEAELSLRSAVASPATGGVLFEFDSVPDGRPTTLPISEDMDLDAEVAAALGHPTVTLKRGQYAIDYSTNPNGSVVVATNDNGTASVDNASSQSLSMVVAPNPAATSASVSFTLAAPQTVSLTMIDARGQVVMTVVDAERMSSGRHERTVDVSSLPAGAYFQRLTVGTATTITPVQIAR